ncbi:MAG: hypothetical protein AAF974_11375, partial [Cyanobacteria bacterium P01_E01_bin.34]
QALNGRQSSECRLHHWTLQFNQWFPFSIPTTVPSMPIKFDFSKGQNLILERVANNSSAHSLLRSHM